MKDYENYQNLANSIIKQACADYKRVLKKIKTNQATAEIQRKKKELEEFFESDWFRVLTDVSHLALINEIKREIDNEIS